MPGINQASRNLGSDVIVVVVGSGDAEHLAEIHAERAPDTLFAVATDEWREALGVVAFPETLFVDQTGHIAERLQGGQEAAYFEARGRALLAETPGTPTITPPSPAPAAEPRSGKHKRYARWVYNFLEKFSKH